MGRSASYLLKCSPEEKAAWQAEAKRRGVTLAAWLREAANAALDHNPAHPLPGEPTTMNPVNRSQARETCAHGLPRGYCLNPGCK